MRANTWLSLALYKVGEALNGKSAFLCYTLLAFIKIINQCIFNYRVEDFESLKNNFSEIKLGFYSSIPFLKQNLLTSILNFLSLRLGSGTFF